MNKFKKEIWNTKKWRGTQREENSTKNVLVQRDSKGHFVKVISEIHVKTYGSGIYEVGYYHGKPVTRKLSAKYTTEWYTARKEAINKHEILRCSIVLNDIPSTRPTGRNEYYGFRIIAFSHSQHLLKSIYPEKMRQRLIRFIEECLKYKEIDFWFSTAKAYFGHENISKGNSSKSDNGKFYLQWQKRTGSVMKREEHSIGEL